MNLADQAERRMLGINRAYLPASAYSGGTLAGELHAQLRENPEPVIYVSHVPPFGCQDRTKNGDTIGHHQLLEHLCERNWPAALVLCGGLPPNVQTA